MSKDDLDAGVRRFRKAAAERRRAAFAQQSVASDAARQARDEKAQAKKEWDDDPQRLEERLSHAEDVASRRADRRSGPPTPKAQGAQEPHSAATEHGGSDVDATAHDA